MFAAFREARRQPDRGIEDGGLKEPPFVSYD
jgi:hypothetical protein